MGEFMVSGAEHPIFFQFPDFLLKAPVGSTAKLVYMLLYDRARMSEKNDRVIDGKVYVLFPAAELAERLGRTERTVKAAFRELEAAGLLMREYHRDSGRNLLFVLLPEQGKFSDRGRKAYGAGEEKRTEEGKKNVRSTGNFLPPNKNINNNNNNKNTETETRVCYGRYKNIFLTEGEYRRLMTDLPYSAAQIIEEMSVWCEAKRKTYANYEAAIRSWASRDSPPGKTAAAEKYDFREGESF